MKPDSDDQNNQVPAFEVDDDWDVGNDPGGKSGLPPRQDLPGIPEKRRLRQAVNRSKGVVGKGKREGGGLKNAKTLPMDEAGKSGKKIRDSDGDAAAKVETGEEDPELLKELEVDDEVTVDDAAVGREGEKKGIVSARKRTAGKAGRAKKAAAVGASKRARVHEIGGKADTRPQGEEKAQIEARLEDTGEAPIREKRAKKPRENPELTSWGQETKKGGGKWLAYALAGTALVVILAIAINRQLFKARDKEDDTISTFSALVPVAEEPEKMDEIENLTLLGASQQAAMDIYMKFLRAGSPEEVASFLYRSEEVMPLVEQGWRRKEVNPRWVLGSGTQWKIGGESGSEFGTLQGTGPDFLGFTAFFRMEGEELKMDWKATTGYGTAGFEELETGAGDAGEIRGRIAPSGFYTLTFPDTEYRSYRLTSPDVDTAIWVYAKQGGEPDLKLKKIFMGGGLAWEAVKSMDALVSMARGPEGSFSNQWMLTKIHGFSWMGTE